MSPCSCVEHSNDAAAYLRGLKRALEIVQTAPLAGGVEGVMWSERIRALMVGHLEGEMSTHTADNYSSERFAKERHKWFQEEVERRAGATREFMLNWITSYEKGTFDVTPTDNWLRRILGEEKPCAHKWEGTTRADLLICLLCGAHKDRP